MSTFNKASGKGEFRNSNIGTFNKLHRTTATTMAPATKEHLELRRRAAIHRISVNIDDNGKYALAGVNGKLYVNIPMTYEEVVQFLDICDRPLPRTPKHTQHLSLIHI